MKQIHLNLKHGIAKIEVQSQDDLWYLSQIIDTGDFVKGKTLRKIQKGSEEKSRQVKKAVFLKIEVGKVEFSKTSAVLRVGGKVAEGPEDVAKGSWHSFSIEPGTTITLEKQRWLSYQLEKLKEACKSKVPKILICVFDREEAYFALMKKYGYELLSRLKGKVQKKAVEEKVKPSFYSEIIKLLEEYDKRHSLEKIILASPAFWKEDLMKEMRTSQLKPKIVLATCSSVGENGIDEVLKRPETMEALREERAAKEINLVEKVLGEISKDGKSAYGIKEVEQAASAGAVEMLLVTDELIQKLREKEKYGQLDALMKAVDSSKGSITIISSEHEGGKKLSGLGGIAALLRYKLNY
ncbi:mRNA surveillance protein pelota [Candidatus Woesearchaeota archaeon]|nr:mRNA surveillance protein pelota [Candidatus Woesearchaeota archaeon]